MERVGHVHKRIDKGEKRIPLGIWTLQSERERDRAREREKKIFPPAENVLPKRARFDYVAEEGQ